MKYGFNLGMSLSLTLISLLDLNGSHAQAATKSARGQKCNIELAKASASKGPALTPAHDLGPDITNWASHDESLAPVFNSVPQSYSDSLLESGTVPVTIGGTSMTAVFPEYKVSSKWKYDHLPQSRKEFVKMIVDAAAPELKAMAKAGRFNNGDAPIFLFSMPGFVVDGRKISLPSNFGPIGNIENKPLNQSLPNHVELMPIADLVGEELVNRAAELNIAPEILAKSIIQVANDAQPVVANAAFTKLKPGERATVVFIGTGTGSAKTVIGKDGSFTMLSSEESQTKLKDFPKKLIKEIPAHLLLGARLAKASAGSWLPESGELTLENISGGGRDLVDGAKNYKVANHLMGADTVALSLLLSEREMPQWVQDRVDPREYLNYRGQVLESLGFSEKDLRKMFTYGSPDLDLILQVKNGKFMDRKTIKTAAKAGSRLALQIMKAQDYTEGLVTGLIAMNIGATPSGNVIPVDLVYGKKNKKDKYEIKILVRASAGMGDWAHETFFEQSLKGVEDAKTLLLKDEGYQQKLASQGYDAPKPKDLTLTVERIYSEDLTVHPDLTGLDQVGAAIRKGLSK